MTKAESYFISLLSSYLSGEAPQNADDSDMNELFSLAHIHKLCPIVYSVLKKTETDQAALSGFKRNTILLTASQIGKSERFLKICEELEKNDIHFAVVKGIVLRSIYPEPELRISADEDVLVRGDDYERASGIICDSGLEEEKNDNEFSPVRTFVCKASGLHIELHRTLFSRDSNQGMMMDDLFSDVFSRIVKTRIGKTSVPTLSPTDHLLFLILHSFKHFIYCGFGIRQVMDFAVFARTYSDEIDHSYIVSSLEKVNAAAFFACILDICEKHLGIEKEELGFGASDIGECDSDEMMQDILSGGAYGNSSPERVHSTAFTQPSVSREKKTSTLSALFPPYDVMVTKYAYVRRCKLLLPVSWIHRMAKQAFGGNKSFDAAESIEIGKRRVEMLRKYGIIK